MFTENGLISAGLSHDAETWVGQRKTSGGVDVAGSVFTFTNAGGGLYYWEGTFADNFIGYVIFTSSPAGLIKTAAVEAESSGGVSPPPPPPPPGTTGLYYNTQADMEQQRGIENIRSWSNKGADGDTDTVAVTRAIRDAKNIIDSKLRTVFVYPYLSSAGAAIPADVVDTLNRISETIASFQTYAARGLDVENDPVGNLMKQEYDRVMAELDYYVSGQLFIDLQREDQTSEPRAAVVDPLYELPWHYSHPYRGRVR